MTEELRFSGKCPNCEQTAGFVLPTGGQTVGAMAKFLVQMGADFLEKKNPFKRFTGDDGRIGRCQKCQSVVLQCPRCGAIHRREYDPSPCSQCGKAYNHP